MSWAIGTFGLLAGALLLGGALSLGSTSIALVPLLLFGGGAVLAWIGRPKLLLVGLLAFTAPIDISKAVVPPLSRFYSPGLYLTVGHVVLLALAALWLLRRLLSERRLPPFGAADGYALLFLALIWLGALRSPQGALAVASAMSYSLAVLVFYVASHALEDPAEWRMLLRATVAIVLLQLVYVALQFAAGSPLPLPGSKAGLSFGGVLRFGGEGLAFRPSGFLEHPNALADHMALVMPAALALLLLGWHRVPRWVWWGALVTLAAGGAQLLVSLSRGGWASTVAGMLLVVAVYWRRGLVRTRHIMAGAALAVAAVLVAIAAYPSILLRLTGADDRATESRVILNSQAVAIIRTAPLTGVGFGGYNRAAYETIAPAWALISPEYQQSLLKLVVHNHYLLLAAELGIPTAAYFALLLLGFLRLPWTVRRWHDPALYALAMGLAGSVLAQLLFLNSDNYYADIRIYMLWMMLGVLRGVCRRAQAQDAAAEAAGAPAPPAPTGAAVWSAGAGPRG